MQLTIFLLMSCSIPNKTATIVMSTVDPANSCSRKCDEIIKVVGDFFPSKNFSQLIKNLKSASHCKYTRNVPMTQLSNIGLQ